MNILSVNNNRKLFSCSKFFIMTIVFGLVAAHNASAAADRTESQSSIAESAKFTDQRPKNKFLEPLKLKFILSADDPSHPKLCVNGRDRLQCPPILSNGGSTSGVIPTIEPVITANLPHVRVSFYIQEISNQIIANGGVETDIVNGLEYINWLTTGTDSDVENGGPYGWTLPGPGQTFNNFGPHGGPSGLLIYDALVFNACGSLSSFPVELESTVTESGAVIGTFSGVDNSTIHSTGYYNLNYTIRATDGDGAVSDFQFKGKANVICSGLNTL